MPNPYDMIASYTTWFAPIFIVTNSILLVSELIAIGASLTCLVPSYDPTFIDYMQLVALIEIARQIGFQSLTKIVDMTRWRLSKTPS